ncbi:unnamed protein product [Chrysoparadoxa australica]
MPPTEVDRGPSVVLDESLYTVLNVPSDALPKDIRNAYLHLASCLHPDRTGAANLRPVNEGLGSVGQAHSNLRELKAQADAQFSRVSFAYHVLSDPIKRRAYDEFGLEGIELLESAKGARAELWEHMKRPSQVKEMMRRVMKQEAENQLERDLNPSGNMTVSCSACPITYNDEGKLEFHARRLWPEINQMVIQHAVDVPVAEDVKVNLGGFVLTRGVVGSGAATFSVHQKVPNTAFWYSWGGDLGFDRKLRASVGHPLPWSGTHGVMGLVDQPGGSTLQLNISRHLSPVMVCTGAVGMGLNGEAVQLGCTRLAKNGKHRLRGEVKVAGSDTGIRGSYTHYLSTSSSAEVGFKLGTAGMEVQCCSGRAISPIAKTKIGLRLSLEGVAVLFRMQRGGMQFQLPIILHRSIDPWATLLSCFVPALVDTLLARACREALGDGAVEAEEEQELLRAQAKDRENAASQVQLMMFMASKKREKEASVGGLVIVSARYGWQVDKDCGRLWFLEPLNTDEEPLGDEEHGMNIDVTVPLQFFVTGSSLQLVGSSKSNLLGFYDIGNKDQTGGPQLYVRYSHAGRLFELTVDDYDALELPSPLAMSLGPSSYMQ